MSAVLQHTRRGVACPAAHLPDQVLTAAPGTTAPRNGCVCVSCFATKHHQQGIEEIACKRQAIPRQMLSLLRGVGVLVLVCWVSGTEVTPSSSRFVAVSAKTFMMHAAAPQRSCEPWLCVLQGCLLRHGCASRLLVGRSPARQGVQCGNASPLLADAPLPKPLGSIGPILANHGSRKPNSKQSTSSGPMLHGSRPPKARMP